MGILDVILGRDAQGSPSKINMALIALMLWRWYQSQSASGAQPQPAPAPRGGGPMPRVPRQQMPEPDDEPAQIPTRKSGSGSDFDELRDSVRRVPRGNGGGEIEAGPGGGLGDILGDILGGGAGRGGAGRGQAGPGGGLGDILGDILGGGKGGDLGRGGAGRGGAGRGQAGPGGGGLGDILGDILGGGGRGGMPGARVSGQQGDPFGGMGGLGGLLAGGAGGGVLADILSQFEQAGKGNAAKSWVSRGENIPVTPKDIESTFGSGIIDELASQFGMPRDELLKGLSEAMPEAVDALTPDGRLPTAEEITRRV